MGYLMEYWSCGGSVRFDGRFGLGVCGVGFAFKVQVSMIDEKWAKYYGRFSNTLAFYTSFNLHT